MYASNTDTADARYATTMHYSSVSAEKMRRHSALLWSAYMILWIGALVATRLSSEIPESSKVAVYIALVVHAGYMCITADFMEWFLKVPRFFTRTVARDEM